MSTRKPKLPELPPFDLPSKQLQLITVSTKAQKAAASRYAAEAELADLQDPLSRPAKTRLH